MPITYSAQAKQKLLKLTAKLLAEQTLEHNPDKSRAEVYAIIDGLRDGIIAEIVESHFTAEEVGLPHDEFGIKTRPGKALPYATKPPPL